MPFQYNGKSYLSDNDFNATLLSASPRIDIKSRKRLMFPSKLSRFFRKNYGRDFLGGDEVVAYFQSLVTHGMDFNKLEDEILHDFEKYGNQGFKDFLFKKTASGIGRGHSLGGLSSITLGIHGTKMIDSALTGLCMSRSLATSSRRRETGADEIAIPEALGRYPELLREYMEISGRVLDMAGRFKDKFGKSDGIETFNKVIPYNNPADLQIVLPLDTITTIASEVRSDSMNPNGKFIPREIYKFAEMIPEITRKAGLNMMFSQRMEVPRDTYFHYTVFKDPSQPNYALEKSMEKGMPKEPMITKAEQNLSPEFMRGLTLLKEIFGQAAGAQDPKELHEKSLKCVYALRKFTEEFNNNVHAEISDTLSWRVWSEQKRHATLRQHVESVYSAVSRAADTVFGFWPLIQQAYSENNYEKMNGIMGKLEKSIVIDERLKKKSELIVPYVYHTAEQLMFYKKMIENGIEPRDALYIAPKNTRLRTLEYYDAENLFNLELPLRLCEACEPERLFVSWQKRELLAEQFPELAYFLQPKCRVGFCTEAKWCKRIKDMGINYTDDLHKAVQKAMFDRARSNLR
jgi:hypothetical protein